MNYIPFELNKYLSPNCSWERHADGSSVLRNERFIGGIMLLLTSELRPLSNCRVFSGSFSVTRHDTPDTNVRHLFRPAKLFDSANPNIDVRVYARAAHTMKETHVKGKPRIM